MSELDATDALLGATYSSLTTHLAQVLDLVSGAAVATQPTVYTDELAGLLDLDAGLAAIVGGDTTATVKPAWTAAAPFAEPSDATRGRPEVAYDFDALYGLDAPHRFALRNRRPYVRLRSALHIDCDLIRCRSDARASLVRVATYAQASHRSRRSSHLSRNNGDGRNIARSLATARVLATDCGLDGNLVEAITSALNHAIALDRAWSRASAPVYRHSDHPALQAAGTAAHDLAEALGQAITYVRSEIGMHARDLNIELPVNSGTGSSLKILERVADLGDNFIGADLRAAHIEEAADLNGVRWSSATSWPPRWADRVRQMSVQIKPGFFLVAGDAGKRSVTQVHT